MAFSFFVWRDVFRNFSSCVFCSLHNFFCLCVFPVKNPLGLKSQISTEDVLHNDSRILTRNLLSPRSWSCGKSIHSSNYSFLIWHHWTFYTMARVNFFWENKTTKNEPSLYLLMSSDYAQDYSGSLDADTLFYAHARRRFVF